jgi:hypothetical protein
MPVDAAFGGSRTIGADAVRANSLRTIKQLDE